MGWSWDRNTIALEICIRRHLNFDSTFQAHVRRTSRPCLGRDREPPGPDEWLEKSNGDREDRMTNCSNTMGNHLKFQHHLTYVHICADETRWPLWILIVNSIWTRATCQCCQTSELCSFCHTDVAASILKNYCAIGAISVIDNIQFYSALFGLLASTL